MAEFILRVNTVGQIEDVETNQSSRTICMPHLRSLALRFDFTSSHSPNPTRVESYGPFRHVLLPSIIKLRIGLNWGSRPSDAEAVICGIANSIRRADARLQNLYPLFGPGVSGDQSKRSLQALPPSPVVVLDILRLSTAVSVFDALTYYDQAEESRPAQKAIFPELRELTVRVISFGCAAADPTDVADSLAKFVVSRWDVPVAGGCHASATELGAAESSAGALQRGSQGIQRLQRIHIMGQNTFQSIKEKMLEDSACRRIVEEGFELEESCFA